MENKTMTAVVKTERGAGNISVMEMPIPVCGDDEVKIEIKFCGICGTDIHIRKDEYYSNPPVILGHEFCGEVAEVGKNVTKYKIGDRVTAENVCIHCDTCYMCTSGHYANCVKRGAQGYSIDGGFTKYVVCLEKNVYPIPENISFEEGALSEPMVCTVHAVMDQTRISAGDIVLITGPGAIGLIAAQAAKAEGGRVILAGTTPDAPRFKIAHELGIETTVDILAENLSDIVMKMSNGDGADVFIECSGSAAAVNSGLTLLKKRGRFTQVGLFGKPISINMDAVALKEIEITGSMSHSASAWRKGLELVKEGKINLKPLVSAVYSLRDWEKGFEDFEAKKGLKILLKP